MNMKFAGPGKQQQCQTVRLATLCFECGTKVECHWPEEMCWAGLSVTPQEYMANALNHDKVEILCDDCLQKRPDVKVEDLQIDGD